MITRHTETAKKQRSIYRSCGTEACRAIFGRRRTCNIFHVLTPQCPTTGRNIYVVESATALNNHYVQTLKSHIAGPSQYSLCSYLRMAFLTRMKIEFIGVCFARDLSLTVKGCTGRKLLFVIAVDGTKTKQKHPALGVSRYRRSNKIEI